MTNLGIFKTRLHSIRVTRNLAGVKILSSGVKKKEQKILSCVLCYGMDEIMNPTVHLLDSNEKK